MATTKDAGKPVRNYKCPQCPQAFFGPDGLNVHLREKHGAGKTEKKTTNMTTEAPFKCPHCPRTFRAAKGMASHLRSAHGIAGSSPSQIANRAKKERAAAQGTQPTPPQPTTPLPPPPPPPHGHAAQPIATKDIPGPPYECPECHDFHATTRAMLGRHRRLTHSVAGKATLKAMQQAGITEVPPRVNPYKKKLGRPLGSKTKPKPETQLVTERTHIPDATRNGHHPEDAAALDPIPYARGIGRVEEILRQLAEEFDIPARQYARGVISALWSQTRR